MGDYPLKDGCPTCGWAMGTIERNGPHTELKCKQCDRHIKFIKKAEAFSNGGHEAPEAFDKNERHTPFPPPELEVLKKISFQLDVIMEHFGIAQKAGEDGK